LLKDTSNGPFIDEWKRVYAEISDKVEEVDIAQAISSAALAVKDENELVCATII
jgi:nucleosome binding factor SPN SPT16 subunit